MDNITNIPQHIAIIMDGNRRWAREKGIDTKEGHKAGAENLEKIAYYCNDLGVKYLTVYAFSTENWKRSKEEVSALMILLKNYLKKFSKNANKENVRIKILGNISNLEEGLKKSINEAVERTKDCTGLTLNVAFNYGGRDEITNAAKQIAKKVAEKEISLDDINESMFQQYLYTKGEPDPDLLIRPGGELRISNFLPWQLVYSEFYFTDKYWPDFSSEDLLKAIEVFNKRNRKFGGK
ncbi:MAG: isoprenyl transferase [Clostridia bacterium]|nr:isoprenyl transferase [Clostridia bacterium]